MREYEITGLSSKQAKVTVEALDLYSRLRTGQLEELVKIFRYSGKSGKATHLGPDALNRAEALMGEVKRLLFPELPGNSSFGIRNAPDQPSKVAYDVQQVMRHCVAWTEDKPVDNNPHTVHHEAPWACAEDRLPVMRALTEESHGF